jgi:hypothetical protein
MALKLSVVTSRVLKWSVNRVTQTRDCMFVCRVLVSGEVTPCSRFYQTVSSPEIAQPRDGELQFY